MRKVKARALPWTRWGLRPQTPISAARLFLCLLGEASNCHRFSGFAVPQRFFVNGVWGRHAKACCARRPQRVQGRALAFLPGGLGMFRFSAVFLLACVSSQALAGNLVTKGEGWLYWRSGNPADVQTATQPGIMFEGGGTDVDAAYRW